MKKTLGIIGSSLLMTQLVFTPVLANETSANKNAVLSQQSTDDEEVIPYAAPAGKWYKTLEHSKTGVVRIVVSGWVYYSGLKAISASNAWISDVGGYGTDTKRIDSQSHTVNSTKGASYNIKIGTYDSTVQPDGKFKSSKTYKFTVNPGPN